MSEALPVKPSTILVRNGSFLMKIYTFFIKTSAVFVRNGTQKNKSDTK
jgi:hypothetical protein